MNNLIVFEDKKIRRKEIEGEWFYSVIDVVKALTDSENPNDYWYKVKKRDSEAEIELSTFCRQLKLTSSDGKQYLTDCANVESIFRIIQSIPSKKAEPFKLWLARVGYERTQEIENPELAQHRAKEYYELKGYPKKWIEKRLRGITIRQELTDEWNERKIKGNEFGILTNEISKASFGKTIQEYKEFKSLKKKNQNLRDHMNDWELILTMVGEKATTDITKTRNSKGLNECSESAKEGGKIAGNTRKQIEQKTGKKIITKNNYLKLNKKKKLN